MYTIAIIKCIVQSQTEYCAFWRSYRVDGFINNNKKLLTNLNSDIEDKYSSSAIIILYY